MERVNGDYVGNAWYRRSEKSNRYILQQIKAIFTEIQSIPPPADVRIANVTNVDLYKKDYQEKFLVDGGVWIFQTELGLLSFLKTSCRGGSRVMGKP